MTKAKLTPEQLAEARRENGRKGGHATAKKLTPEQRKENGRKGGIISGNNRRVATKNGGYQQIRKYSAGGGGRKD